jgi:hypothetical protein
MFGPPWTLTLAMPFGLLPSRVGQVLWLVLHLAVVLLSADLLWNYYGGPARYRWLAWVLGVGFGPTLVLLRAGQIGSLILLGVVGFLVCARRGRDVPAGAALALTALKPHLVYLFGLAVLLWALQRRRWLVLAAGGLTLAAATAIPLACNPAVIAQYRDSLGAQPPSQWVTPTLGTALRFALGVQHTWLQVVPTVAGLLWFLSHWTRFRSTWDWAEQAPLLVLVSFLTTFYGAWSHDHVVMLLPVLQVAAGFLRRGRRLPLVLAAAAYLSISGFVLVPRAELTLIGLPAILLLLYLGFRRQLDPGTAGSAGPGNPGLGRSADEVAA